MKIGQIILTLIVLMTLGCENLVKEQGEDYIYDKAFVYKFVVDDTVKAGQIFKVDIYGYLPYWWEFYKTEIEESGNEIIITPIARVKKEKTGIAIPRVAVPFSTTVELLANPNFDSIKISVVGKNGRFEKIIKVIS